MQNRINGVPLALIVSRKLFVCFRRFSIFFSYVLCVTVAIQRRYGLHIVSERQ